MRDAVNHHVFNELKERGKNVCVRKAFSVKGEQPLRERVGEVVCFYISFFTFGGQWIQSSLGQLFVSFCWLLIAISFVIISDYLTHGKSFSWMVIPGPAPICLDGCLNFKQPLIFSSFFNSLFQVPFFLCGFLSLKFWSRDDLHWRRTTFCLDYSDVHSQ